MRKVEQSKHRKRRTFWEPDSKKAKEWLDSQNNISVSIQFIILDAINRYGCGDVIQAFLEHQAGLDDIVAPIQTEKQVEKPTTTEEIVQTVRPVKQVIEPSAKKVEPKEQKVTPTPEPKREQATRSVPERKKDKPKTIREKIDETLDVEIQVMQEEEARRRKNEQEYDPVQIMLNDVGATRR